MVDFKLRKIRKRSLQQTLSEKAQQTLIKVLAIMLLGALLFVSGKKLFDTLSTTRLVGLLSSVAGKDLLTDTKGHTNILLLGAGGEGHEGKDLTDTIIVASLDSRGKRASLLSIPRDLYVDSALGKGRVNQLYEKGKSKWGPSESLNFTRTTIEKILAIPIQYAMNIDFEAFEQVVDALGGVEIFVEETINDPFYPRAGTYAYELFYLPKGLQHLDGKTALKYARSRKTTSDFDRSKRQHTLIQALLQRTKEQNAFARKRFLQQLYDSVKDHLTTNISFREMLSLSQVTAQWNSYNLIALTLNDEPTHLGGFLYTPLRELYGGAFVLLPAGDSFEYIQQLGELLFYGPTDLPTTSIAILNGTNSHGLAAKVRAILHRFGINNITIGNARARDLASTAWYIGNQELKETVTALAKIFPGTISSPLPEIYQTQEEFKQIKIVLELGKNSLPVIQKLDIFKNVVPLKTADS